jgi:hypothetical protein
VFSTTLKLLAMTTQITQTEVMTDGQRKQIKHFMEDAISAMDLESLGFSKVEAQKIIENGDLLQHGMKEYLDTHLKKLTTVTRFGEPIAEFDLTVPLDHNYDTWLDTINKPYEESDDAHYDLQADYFANETHKLVPGKTYRVEIIPILEEVRSQRCINFIKKRGGILVGGMGAVLAQILHKDKLPHDQWILALDEEDAVWQNSEQKPWMLKGSENRPWVLQVYYPSGPGGHWQFTHTSFHNYWKHGCCFFCFYEK